MCHKFLGPFLNKVNLEIHSLVNIAYDMKFNQKSEFLFNNVRNLSKKMASNGPAKRIFKNAGKLRFLDLYI